MTKLRFIILFISVVIFYNKSIATDKTYIDSAKNVIPETPRNPPRRAHGAVQ